MRSVPLFGTDGIRGPANAYPMTAETALALGQAAAYVFRGARGGGAGLHRIIIGKDTRRSGYLFEDALAAGICAIGVDVIQVGPLPTPALAFLTGDMRCDAGIMISASHNPHHDNGIKFFAHDGFKLPDETERRIETLVQSVALEKLRAAPEGIGRARRIDDAAGRYIVFLKRGLPKGLRLDGLHIALDCANGAAYKVGPTVFEELGATVHAIGVKPDGLNINQGCGALHPQRLSELVRETGANIGIALDGDADRALLVCEKGELQNGDKLLAMFARDMQKRGELQGGAVVATEMSNLGLERALAACGAKLIRTHVGDRHVVAAMRESGCALGGEQSGHLVFLEHGGTGDGLYAALRALAIMRATGKPLSELTADFQAFPQAQADVPAATKPPFETLPTVVQAREAAAQKLGAQGRVLLRYSGTEALARVMVEGESEAQVQQLAKELAAVLARALDAPQ